MTSCRTEPTHRSAARARRSWERVERGEASTGWGRPRLPPRSPERAPLDHSSGSNPAAPLWRSPGHGSGRLPPDLARLRTVFTYLRAALGRAEQALAVAEAHASLNAGRPPLPEPPAWLIKHGTGAGRPLIRVPVGGCRDTRNRCSAIDVEQARVPWPRVYPTARQAPIGSSYPRRHGVRRGGPCLAELTPRRIAVHRLDTAPAFPTFRRGLPLGAALGSLQPATCMAATMATRVATPSHTASRRAYYELQRPGRFSSLLPFRYGAESEDVPRSRFRRPGMPSASARRWRSAGVPSLSRRCTRELTSRWSPLSSSAGAT